MKKIKISRLFSLLAVQLLISCSALDLNNQNLEVNKALKPPIVLEKSESKTPDKKPINFFNYDYPRKNGLNQRPLFSLKGGDHLELPNAIFDFPVVYNKRVEVWINYFLTRGRGFFKRYSQRASLYGPLIVEILKDFDLPKDLIFLAMAVK